jgi:hypothetical protein
VRRVSAISLLGVFGFLLLAPFVSANDADAALPACCRANGKHHCAAVRARLAPGQFSGPVFLARGARCPLFPCGNAVPGHIYTVSRVASASLLSPVLSHPASPVQAEARFRISFTRACQKRGPPAFLS